MDAIFERASVRKFTGDPVSDADAEQLMRAAMAAPSAGNQQPWEFYLTRDRETLVALSKASAYARPLRGAALGIVVCGRTEGLHFLPCAPQDLSAAVENILLEATELGLGAVWMGISPDPERMEKVARVIDMPAGLEAFALIAVGHPAGEVNVAGPGRYDPARVHYID